jgi:shikimate dehydrogenase
VARQTFAFIGVTASRSSINAVFPKWAETLGLGEVTFEALDLDLDTPPGRYREVVDQIAADPGHRGALVTTHKVRLLNAARQRFDELDPYARALGEVSSISKRDGRLIGHAKDPITAGRSLSEVLAPDHFARTGGHVLCLGAGGAGLAIAVHVLSALAVPPARVLLTDRNRARLDECAGALDRLGVGDRVNLIPSTDPDTNDRLVTAMPDGSLIVNATGMGKDLPGSPITDAAVFPRGGVAWELNYRGDLDFLRQAGAQREARRLLVVDGWRYFVHGWSAVVAEAFDLTLDEATLDRLADIARSAR